MWSLLFWKAAAERAISTAAQFALVLIGTDVTGFLSVNWEQLIIASLIGGLTSLLKSLATAKLSRTVLRLWVISRHSRSRGQAGLV